MDLTFLDYDVAEPFETDQCRATESSQDEQFWGWLADAD
jgi:hypothetical protein